MYLKEVFDQLSYAELSQLSIGGQEMGVINEDNYDRMVAHVNLGLTALYKRFQLKHGSVEIKLTQDQTSYSLLSKYDVNNAKSKEINKYLENLMPVGTKFLDDVLKIEEVLLESGLCLPLNLGKDKLSVVTPTQTTIVIPKVLVDGSLDKPEDLKTSTVVVNYRANHPKIVIPLGYFDPAKVELSLPDSYVTALCLFVASRAHTPTGMQAVGTEGNNWFTKYEAECQRLETENLQIDQGDMNTRLERGGWV